MFPACKSGNIDLVKYLVSLDKINIKSKSITFFNFNSVFNSRNLRNSQIFFNKTILHLACKSGNIDLVRYIVSLGKIKVSSQKVFY